MLPRASVNRPLGFTLLEVILATMIVGLLSLTLYRFLNIHLAAVRIDTESEDRQAELQSTVALLRARLNELDPQDNEALLGRPNKFNGLSNDEITWKASAGAGLLTAAAAGEFRVTLTVQPMNERSSETELGLRRSPIDPDEKSFVALDRGGGDRKYNWLSLVQPIAALEIRYFDQNLGVWQDAWTAADRYPSLVRVRLWKHAGDPPVEAILPVPAANTQQ